MSQPKVFADLIVKYFWPFFLKYIWPVIVKYVQGQVARGLNNLTEGIKRSVSDRMQKRREDAEARAREATAAAEVASTQAEREQHEKIAQVWREVAEQFRAENETLKVQVIELTTRTQQILQDDFRRSDPVLENLASTPSLFIGGNRSPLPALPYEQDSP
ncbi:MAG: hypothetical protein WC856_18815 [Methylococcaceae bacterium]